MLAATPGRSPSASTWASSLSGRAVSSETVRPPYVTASASGRRPVPAQRGQGSTSTYWSTRAAQRRAAGVRQRLQHVAPGALVGALVGPLDPVRLAVRVHGDHRLLVGEQDPVPVGLRQVLPGPVDVVAHRREDLAEVLALPGAGPGGDRPLADAQGRVRDQRGLGGPVHPGEAVALRAGAGGGVRRERVRVQPGGPLRVAAGAGEQHPQRVGQRGEGADGRACGRHPAGLPQRDGRRQPGDLVDGGGADLLQQPPGVRRHRLEVAQLRLGVHRAEGQRRLAGAGDPGDHHEGVPGEVDVDAAQVVLARAADRDEAGVLPRGGQTRASPSWVASRDAT